MTDKEKAKAYDEAIRKAKIILGCCNSDSIITKHTIYDIFPELNESEDERMIKFIKQQLFNIKKTITENYELDTKLDANVPIIIKNLFINGKTRI